MSYLRNYIGLVILGLMNNVVYVIVISSAQKLVQQFHSSSVGNVTWATNATGLLCRAAAALLEKTTFAFRVCLTASFIVTGLLLSAFADEFSDKVGYWVAIIGVIMIGTAGNLGESVMLGYQRLFPSRIVGGWSMGTGLAGIAGSGLYLAIANERLRWVFLGCLGFVCIYILTFAFVVQRPRGRRLSIERGLMDNAADQDDARNDDNDDDSNAAGRGPEIAHVITEEESEGKGFLDRAPAETKWQRIARVTKAMVWLGANMGFVYYFEYVISQGSASSAWDPAKPRISWLERNSYAVLQFCYQLGVFLSRSSLRFVKIHHVEYLTILQGLNFALWLCQDKWYFMPLYLQLPLMIFVGLMGGASYVNIFYRILNDPPKHDKVRNADRELACNVSASFMNTGIILAGITSVVLEKVNLFKSESSGGGA